MRMGAIAVVAPFRYTAALWATLAGFLVWSDFPDLMAIGGTLFIIGSGLYTFYRELAAKCHDRARKGAYHAGGAARARA